MCTLTVYGYLVLCYTMYEVIDMAVSDAHKAASAKWNASRDNIMIRPTKEEGAAIRAAAEQAGQSVQQFILQAVRERMERDSGKG